MPKISDKGLTMPESPIRKLVPYAEKLKKPEEKYITSILVNPIFLRLNP
jgi:aspartate aminotransferase